METKFENNERSRMIWWAQAESSKVLKLAARAILASKSGLLLEPIVARVEDLEESGRGRRPWWKTRLANGWTWLWHDACNKKTGCVDGCVVGGASDEGSGNSGEMNWIKNLRAIRPSTLVNGMYFRSRGSIRRRLWDKIILGERPAIITWCPSDTTVEHERKWWGDDGTCQQFCMRKQMYCPATRTWMFTSPVPSIIESWPKAVRWTLCPGVYVVNKEQSLKMWDGRVQSTMR